MIRGGLNRACPYLHVMIVAGVSDDRKTGIYGYFLVYLTVE